MAREHRQRADVVIVAANAVGTPWLLLSSAVAGHPEGLANSSGLVGRRLMVHPFGAVAGVFEDPLSQVAEPGRSAAVLRAVLRDG